MYLPVGWDVGVRQVGEAESCIADDDMHRAAQAAVGQIRLAGAVVDRAGALVHVVVTVECHIHLHGVAMPSSVLGRISVSSK
jgi:hypothetical protein